MLLQTIGSISFLLALSCIAIGETALVVRIDQAHMLRSIMTAVNDGAMQDARDAMVEKLAHPDDPTGQDAPQPRETTFPLCVSVNTTCGVRIRETFTRTDLSMQNPSVVESANPCMQQLTTDPPQVCNIEQGNGIIEGRSDIRIRVSIVSQPGTEMASMQSTVRLRTLNVPPYALIVGIANPLADNPLGGTGDIGGIPSNQDADAGTLILAVDPCRKIPANSPVSMKGEKLSWGNWQGTEKDNGFEMPCLPGAGRVNLFATGQTFQPTANSSNWSF